MLTNTFFSCETEKTCPLLRYSVAPAGDGNFTYTLAFGLNQEKDTEILCQYRCQGNLGIGPAHLEEKWNVTIRVELESVRHELSVVKATCGELVLEGEVTSA